MKITFTQAIFTLTILLFHQAINAQTQSDEQHQHKNENHHQHVNQRGDREMGFSHAKTTHHFRLKSDGGIIEVIANKASDTTSRVQIHRHLKSIAQKFSDGDFSSPKIIHGKIPPGAEMMKNFKSEIKYTYQKIRYGGQVHISTNNPELLKAIHEFLRFQIQDHQTGDSIEVEQTPSD